MEVWCRKLHYEVLLQLQVYILSNMYVYIQLLQLLVMLQNQCSSSAIPVGSSAGLVVQPISFELLPNIEVSWLLSAEHYAMWVT